MSEAAVFTATAFTGFTQRVAAKCFLPPRLKTLRGNGMQQRQRPASHERLPIDE